MGDRVCDPLTITEVVQCPRRARCLWRPALGRREHQLGKEHLDARGLGLHEPNSRAVLPSRERSGDLAECGDKQLDLLEIGSAHRVFAQVVEFLRRLGFRHSYWHQLRSSTPTPGELDAQSSGNRGPGNAEETRNRDIGAVLAVGVKTERSR